MLRDLASGSEKPLGENSRRGDWHTALTWSADSRTVLADISSSAFGSSIMAYPLRGGAPYQVYVSATQTGRLAVRGNLLALETDTTNSMLARATTAPAAQPDVIDQANSYTWSPTFAPDGTLAFLSNRSGNNAIWVMKPGAAAPAMLLDGGFAQLRRVRFSPDGTRLALAILSASRVTIRIMTAAGATLTSFEMPSLGLGLPSWTPDGKAVIVFDRSCLCTYRISADNPAQRSKFAAPHWVAISIRPQGTFATRADQDGIWRIDGGTKQISAVYPRFFDVPLAFRGDDVLVPDNELSPPRILAQPLAGGPARPVAYAPGGRGAAYAGESQNRRDLLCRGGGARHQYRSSDPGEAIGWNWPLRQLPILAYKAGRLGQGWQSDGALWAALRRMSVDQAAIARFRLGTMPMDRRQTPCGCR